MEYAIKSFIILSAFYFFIGGAGGAKYGILGVKFIII